MFLWLFLNLIIGNYEYLYQVHSIASQMFYKIYIFLFSHNSLENICARVIFWTFRRLQAWKFIKKKFRQSCFRPATVLKTEIYIFQRIWQFYFQEKQCISSAKYYNNKIYFTNVFKISLYHYVVTSIGNSSHTCNKCV